MKSKSVKGKEVRGIDGKLVEVKKGRPEREGREISPTKTLPLTVSFSPRVKNGVESVIESHTTTLSMTPFKISDRVGDDRGSWTGPYIIHELLTKNLFTHRLTYLPTSTEIFREVPPNIETPKY